MIERIFYFTSEDSRDKFFEYANTFSIMLTSGLRKSVREIYDIWYVVVVADAFVMDLLDRYYFDHRDK